MSSRQERKLLVTAGVEPAASLKAGTVSSVGTIVRGVGTNFEKDVQEGDYIYNNAQGAAAGHEVRKVVAVYAKPNSSSQRFDIEKAFTVDLPGLSTLHIVKRRWRKAQIVNVGAANAKINNVAIEPGEPAKIVFGSDRPTSSVEPFTYDGTGGNDLQVTLEE